MNTVEKSENLAPFHIKHQPMGRVNSQLGERTKYQRLMQKNLKNPDSIRSNSNKPIPHLRLPPATMAKKELQNLKPQGKNFIKIH